MAHHVYTTDALILESSPGKEADKFCMLFTRDLGRMRASARGVRLEKSKLRYSLQDFSFTLVSVVKGKEFWRITNATLQKNLYQEYKDSKETIHVLAEIFHLLRRLVPDEEKNEVLFDMLANALDFLGKEVVIGENKKDSSKEYIKAFESILVLRILDNLGYLKKVTSLEHFITSPWSLELLTAMKSTEKVALNEINRSIRETHL